jgi:hypothetical protein
MLVYSTDASRALTDASTLQREREREGGGGRLELLERKKEKKSRLQKGAACISCFRPHRL